MFWTNLDIDPVGYLHESSRKMLSILGKLGYSYSSMLLPQILDDVGFNSKHPDLQNVVK
jgi:hypothetical protein